MADAETRSLQQIKRDTEQIFFGTIDTKHYRKAAEARRRVRVMLLYLAKSL
jgi:hypothetical protein